MLNEPEFGGDSCPDADANTCTEEYIPQEPANKVKVEPRISNAVLNEFVQDRLSAVDKDRYFKTDQHLVFNKKYRINVWTQHFRDGAVVPTANIVNSYLLELTDGGDVIDVTSKSDWNRP